MFTVCLLVGLNACDKMDMQSNEEQTTEKVAKKTIIIEMTPHEVMGGQWTGDEMNRSIMLRFPSAVIAQEVTKLTVVIPETEKARLLEYVKRSKYVKSIEEK